MKRQILVVSILLAVVIGTVLAAQARSRHIARQRANQATVLATWCAERYHSRPTELVRHVQAGEVSPSAADLRKLLRLVPADARDYMVVLTAGLSQMLRPTHWHPPRPPRPPTAATMRAAEWLDAWTVLHCLQGF